MTRRCRNGRPLGAIAVSLLAIAIAVEARAETPMHEIEARLIAIGIPGIGGVRQVGRFHAGGPIPGNPEFLLYTRPGRVLDPERVLVASRSNFGAPPANPELATGSVLSLATTGATPLTIAPGFAARGDQSSHAGGAVQLYTAQSTAFLNRHYNRRALTADLPAVAGASYISINNAFGRPWVASHTAGASGSGLNTVLDPDGRPLDNAPSNAAGGVFAGARSNRPDRQLTAGDLSTAALGTAFLGPSPDASGRAVFAVVTAAGSVVQVHVEHGVDGLAPAGTVHPVAFDAGLSTNELIGIAFNWVPDRALLIADRAGHRVARLHLGDDGEHFTLRRVEYLTDPALKGPTDLAPAVPEIANPRFSSHTSLAGNADLYVVNRDDGSLLRMTQAGRVVARARVALPGVGIIGADRLRAIAVSADAQRIWLTLEGEIDGHRGRDGAVIELSGFDASGPFRRVAASGAMTAAGDEVRRGEALFHREFGTQDGLGPLFNARSCLACHHEPGPGGMSSRTENFVLRVAHMNPVTGRVAALNDAGGPIAHRFSTRDLGDATAPRAGIPARANVVSTRMPTALYGLALLDRIPDEAILANAIAKGDGIHGRPNRVVTANGERRIGRFGWKADVASLDEMVAQAFANEIGITSPLAPGHTRADTGAADDDDGSLMRAVVAYLRTLGRPRQEARR